jgi:hypothetical protein
MAPLFHQFYYIKEVVFRPNLIDWLLFAKYKVPNFCTFGLFNIYKPPLLLQRIAVSKSPFLYYFLAFFSTGEKNSWYTPKIYVVYIWNLECGFDFLVWSYPGDLSTRCSPLRGIWLFDAAPGGGVDGHSERRAYKHVYTRTYICMHPKGCTTVIKFTFMTARMYFYTIIYARMHIDTYV